MPDDPGPNANETPPPIPSEDDVLTEPMEVETPRRAASAQFVVDAEVGSEAVLREAMDPANQSLADALRLSFRVLQVVMLVLVLLFLASGFQKVADGQSGVLTVFGRVVEVGGQEALGDGLQWSRWPYPIGEFVLFQVDNRPIELVDRDEDGTVLGDTFWPRLGPGLSMEDALDRARTSQPLRAGRDGALLTRDGGFAHIRLTGDYEIAQPRRFVDRIKDGDADRLVRLAVQRAAVLYGTGQSLQELVDLTDDGVGEIRRLAQELLDGIEVEGERGSGIEISDLSLPEAPIPPLAIQAAFGDLQSAFVEADSQVERARKEANQTLTGAGGEHYRDILDLIDEYEEAIDRGTDEQAERKLDEINEWLEGDDASGDVAEIIKLARSYVSEVEASLGNEARRFAGLLPTYREHPQLVVSERWLDVYSDVLSRADAEKFFAPPNMGHMRLVLTGLDTVANLRRKLLLERRERESMSGFDAAYPYILRAEDIRSGPGRRLNVEGGEVVAPGAGR